jgi:oxygen-independent coproporphyrinogen-3 oxidase
MIEYIMLRLRLRQGISFADFSRCFGKDFMNSFQSAVEKTSHAGVITTDSEGIRPTLKGFALQNALIGEYIKKL